MDIFPNNKATGCGDVSLHSAFGHVADGIVFIDIKGIPALANQAGKDAFGFLGVKRAADGSITSIQDISLQDIFNELFAKKQHCVSFEVSAKPPGGKQYVVSASAVNKAFGDGVTPEGGASAPDAPAGIVLVFRDAAQAQQSQDAKADKLLAAGSLVAGAAHELNNPLAGIQLCTELVASDPAISEKAKKYLDRIQKESEQIQSVIKSLLTLTGNYTLLKQQVDVNKILEEVIMQKKPQFDYENVKYNAMLDTRLPALLVDGQQIRRVFQNVIDNACLSMAETQKEKVLTIQSEVQKNHARITISDTGPGIPVEYLTKIFEPFFTIKGSGKKKGTGLGLSIAHSIIHLHNGRIYAVSEPGKGATFIIELPLK